MGEWVGGAGPARRSVLTEPLVAATSVSRKCRCPGCGGALMLIAAVAAVAATPSPWMRPGVVTACCVSWKSDQACNVTVSNGHVLAQSCPDPRAPKQTPSRHCRNRRKARGAASTDMGCGSRHKRARRDSNVFGRGAACHAGTPASICRRRVSSRIRCSRISAACSIALRRSRVGSRGATGMFGMPAFLVEFGRGLHVPYSDPRSCIAQF